MKEGPDMEGYEGYFTQEELDVLKEALSCYETQMRDMRDHPNRSNLGQLKYKRIVDLLSKLSK
jgi:hypothetical protein